VLLTGSFFSLSAGGDAGSKMSWTPIMQWFHGSSLGCSWRTMSWHTLVSKTLH